MAEQKAAARAAWKGSGHKASDDVWFDIAEDRGATEFTGYSEPRRARARCVALVKDGVARRVQRARRRETSRILTNQTPFYGESGGQTGDVGPIRADSGFAPAGDRHVEAAGASCMPIRPKIEIRHDPRRRHAVHLAVDRGSTAQRIRANQSAPRTCMHAALRKELGWARMSRRRAAWWRRGSPALRLLASQGADAPKQIDGDRGGREPRRSAGNAEVSTRLMSPEDAIEAGAMALFGEKYGDEEFAYSPWARNRSRAGAWFPIPSSCAAARMSTALGDIALFKILSAKVRFRAACGASRR